MEILARYEFHEEHPWPVEYAAPPLIHDGRVFFAWENHRQIRCLQLAFDGSCTESGPVSFLGRDVVLPDRWIPFVHEGKVYLSCGNSDPADHVFPDRKVDIVMLSFENLNEVHLPEEVRQQHLCRKMLREDADVVLGSYTMRYRNSRSYECIGPDGTVLWQEKHKGYRYTDFEVRKGCVIFGTAGGYGGGLYCYRLSDGACLCAVDTKGTERYCWQNGLILTRGREGQLLWVDPFAGQVVRSMTLDTKLTDESGICADERYVAAVGFHKKTSQPMLYLIDTEE